MATRPDHQEVRALLASPTSRWTAGPWTTDAAGRTLRGRTSTAALKDRSNASRVVGTTVVMDP